MGRHQLEIFLLHLETVRFLRVLVVITVQLLVRTKLHQLFSQPLVSDEILARLLLESHAAQKAQVLSLDQNGSDNKSSIHILYFVRIDGDLESPGHASIFSIVLIKIIRNNFLDIFDFIFLRIAIEDIAKRRRILNYLSLVIQGKEKWSSSQLLLFHHRDENELVVSRIACLLQL